MRRREMAPRESGTASSGRIPRPAPSAAAWRGRESDQGEQILEVYGLAESEVVEDPSGL